MGRHRQPLDESKAAATRPRPNAWGLRDLPAPSFPRVSRTAYKSGQALNSARRTKPEDPMPARQRRRAGGHLASEGYRECIFVPTGNRRRQSQAPSAKPLRLRADLLCNAFRIFENNPGAVGGSRAGRLAIVEDPWVRPEGYARAPTAPHIVAHDVSPFGAVHIAMPIGDRHVRAIGKSIMPDAQDVPYSWAMDMETVTQA
jgi:hypothetical protein